MTFATANTGDVPYAELTRQSKRDYCEKFGYDFFAYDIPAGINPYWGQVPAMIEGLARCDGWLNYTGADSYIVPGSGSCEHLLDENFDLIISKDENGLNNNGFFLRKDEWASEFLRRVWELKADTVIRISDNGDGIISGAHGWWEQAGFVLALRDMGLGRVKFIPQIEINAYPWKPNFEKAFIAHVPGRSQNERLRMIRKALVPGETEISAEYIAELKMRRQARGFFGLNAEEHAILRSIQ